MLDQLFFDQWVSYLCSVKGWALTLDDRKNLYFHCTSVDDAIFQTIATEVAASPGAKPDRLLSAIREYKLLQRTGSAPMLRLSSAEHEHDRAGPLMGRRFMIWSILANRDHNLEQPYDLSTRSLTPTGQWLRGLPILPSELKIVRTSVAQIWADGFDGDIAKELIAFYQGR